MPDFTVAFRYGEGGLCVTLDESDEEEQDTIADIAFLHDVCQVEDQLIPVEHGCSPIRHGSISGPEWERRFLRIASAHLLSLPYDPRD